MPFGKDEASREDACMGTGLSRLVGVGCLLASLYCAQRSLEFRRHGEVVSGTVVAVDVRVTASSEGVEREQRTEIRYTPKESAAPYVLKSNWNGALFGRHDLGDQVAVRYLPDDPGDAREDSLLLDWLLPLLLVLLGIAGVCGRLQSESRGWEFTLWRHRRE
jgi:hypothetical protein